MIHPTFSHPKAPPPSPAILSLATSLNLQIACQFLFRNVVGYQVFRNSRQVSGKWYRDEVGLKRFLERCKGD